LIPSLIAIPGPARSGDRDYRGEDGGYLVYSVGAPNNLGLPYWFSYHRTATVDGRPAEDWKDRIYPRLGGAIYLRMKRPDFTGAETGQVHVQRLPSGSYVVDEFHFDGLLPGVVTYSWSSGKPFSLPFTIRPGEATYIGTFMRFPSLGTSLQPVLGAAGFFVVADRSERDLSVAKTKLPESAKITVQVTDVSRFGNAALRVSPPDAR
jgi:hypothetical protein